MSNEDLEANVSDELLWDPKVDPGEIGVFANDGVVTLRGTVGSFRMKREAKQDAERVYGVKSVQNAAGEDSGRRPARRRRPPRRRAAGAVAR